MGAIVQVISGPPHVSLVFAIGWALVCAASGYWWGSTRLHERRSGIDRNSEISVYVADTVQVLNLHRE